MSLIKVRVGVAAIVTVCVAAVAPGAAGVTTTYATSGSPQVISDYGSTVKSYGSWSVWDRTAKTVTSTTTSYYKFVDGDDHKAFVTLMSDIHSRKTGEDDGFTVTTSHDNTVSGSWSAFIRQALYVHEINSVGTLDGKARIKTCIDVPLRPDPCGPVKQLNVTWSVGY